jgi:signal transduction histidine kinase
MSRVQVWRTALASLALLATAEWLRAPGTLWPLVALGAGVAAGFAAVRRGGAVERVGAAALLTLATFLGLAQYRVHRLDVAWPEERDQRIERVRSDLGRALRDARARTNRLAADAGAVTGLGRSAAFDRLRSLVGGEGPERAVAILEGTGVPWAWAGRHRLAPMPTGDSSTVRFSPFYATLEARRLAPSGRVVVATTLLWADSAVPRPERSLTADLSARSGVQLRVFPAGTAPATGELLDYSEPTTAGDRLLFSVLVSPPDQDDARQQLLADQSGWLAAAWVGLLVAALATAGGTGPRFVLLAALLWCTSRAPIGSAVGLDDLFSPATYSRSFLGPLSRSAGNLLLAGGVASLGAIWLWRRRLEAGPWRSVLGGLLVIGAPYLVSALGRGIDPPVSGVSTPLWVTWQLTLTVTTAAVILLAAALFHGGSREAPAWRVWLGVCLAVAAAAIGVVVWEPRAGWPEWYSFTWLPALALVTRPAPRWATLTGAAMVAGTAAALVTWGAELNARVVAAQRDLSRLGDVWDPLAEPLLARFGDELGLAGPIRSPSEMYVHWRSSDLAGQEYPVRMELWQRDGTRRAALVLDSLDAPASLVSALVRALPAGQPRAVVPLLRVPGRHYVLIQRQSDSTILSAVIGPRSRLMGPARLARLLRPPPDGPPLYAIGLGPPLSGAAGVPERRVPWWRETWRARTQRLVEMPGGARHVHAEVPLGDPPGLAIRGTLIVILDVGVLLLLWALSEFRWETLTRLPLRRATRSFQVRLAVVLGLFFVVPATGFTVWSLSQVQNEAEGRRDLLIAQALRDAVLTAGGLLQGTDEYLAEGLTDLSNRLEAEFALYSGGRLVATSAPILEQLALVDPLLDNRTYQRMVLGDELELLRNGTTYVAPVRVGYRVVQAGPPGGVGILATTQLAGTGEQSRERHDLVFGLLFATLVGGLGAVVGAQVVARFLSRPVAELQRSAVAVGQGAALPPHGPPPVEFEAVFTAFDRMVTDIRTSQTALERARQRTAAVLGNVATAVVAVDADGRVLVSNARARQLLDAALPDGARFSAAVGPAWRPIAEAAAAFLQGSEADGLEDFDVDGRQVRLQLARLGEGPGGVVLALDDLTDATRAARVLAWGEMARQVAHEIKNPLTPIRLGMQHLQRVRRDRPEAFDGAFETTSGRILSEIDRLDTIARAFSRFGLPAGELAPLEEVELAGPAREVAALYQLSQDGVTVTVTGSDGIRRPGRRDEVKEVLGNLLENARNAGARRVTIAIEPATLAVRDDGRGIQADFLPRIFEPRFSTTTSGAGLGLPIVKRLVEGWGARIEVVSEVGSGTTVSIRWPRSPAA